MWGLNIIYFCVPSDWDMVTALQTLIGSLTAFHIPQWTTNTRNSNTARSWDIYKYLAYYQGRLWICISKVVYWVRNSWGKYKITTPFLSLKNTKFIFPLLLDSNKYSSFISPEGVPIFLQVKWVLNVPGKSLWWFSPSSQNGDLSWFASFNGLKIQVKLDFFLIHKTRGGR